MTLDTPHLNWLYELRRRAAAADAWAERHWRIDDLARSTRRPALCPGPGGCEIISAASVDDLARRRAEALRADGVMLDYPSTGRILAFDRDGTLSDGAAAAESSGLFDEDNAPPWDSWLLFVVEEPRTPGHWAPFDSYLLCWIPAPLVAMATRAIEVIPEACLRWADELDAPHLARLARAGIALPGAG